MSDYDVGKMDELMSQPEPITFEHICEGTKCKHYIVWGWGGPDCYSCMLIGQSYNVTHYPQNCQFINKMQKFEKEFNNPPQ